MKYYCSLILVTFSLFTSFAQGPSKRYDFAKSYFGVDIMVTPAYGESTFLNSSGERESFAREGFVTPAINIGATHFWGYADLYVSISTANIGLKKQEITSRTAYGALTGFRIYPWRLTDGRLRPFAGYKFSPFYHEQDDVNGSDASLTKVKGAVDVGIGYRMPSAYVFLAYNRVVNPSLDIAISRTEFASTHFPRHFVNFGINWMIETTRTSQNETFRKLNELFGGTNSYGWFVGIGPSAAFPLISSSAIKEDLSFLDDLSMPAIFADMATGYHFSKYEFTAAFSYRGINQLRGALGYKQLLKRRSFLLEGYKFLGDYHGFNPFIGGGISYERLQLSASDNGILVRDEGSTGVTPVITFGWDIRPTKKHDIFLLRTNLRYSPLLKFPTENTSLSLQHLEFNFIQVVVYPQRIMKMRKMRRGN